MAIPTPTPAHGALGEPPKKPEIKKEAEEARTEVQPPKTTRPATKKK